jgi:putative transport protein
MEWLRALFTGSSIAQLVIIYGVVIAVGIWFGRIKLFGISLGVTWVLFIAILISYSGIVVNKEIKDFLKEFGLILFVYSIGLQVGPGFFASLKKDALGNNLLAASVVVTGILTTCCFIIFQIFTFQ